MTRRRGVRGHCSGALTCRVVDSDASIRWSGMRQSESTCTHDAHLTVVVVVTDAAADDADVVACWLAFDAVVVAVVVVNLHWLWPCYWARIVNTYT